MLKLALQRWIRTELAPIEQQFPLVDGDETVDFLGRIVMYLVYSHGYPTNSPGDNEKGMIIASENLNQFIGHSADIKFSDEAYTIIVTKE